MPQSALPPSALPPLRIRHIQTLPIVQGGMGVGISAHQLAGNVAAAGAVGTIASVDLRRLHPDLMAQTEAQRDRATIEAANLTALAREITAAKHLAQGRGLIAVNVMRAVSQWADYVRQSCQSGADAIVMGAGLALELPDLTREHPNVALIPILSDVRGVSLLLKKWQRKNRLPDAIVIEHPRYAGGHLGATRPQELSDPRFEFHHVIPGVLELFQQMGLEAEKIPLITAGGINTHQKIRDLLSMGASGVQLGTAFAVTQEGDASDTFKQVLVNAQPEQVVEFMSCAGLPARAVKTPWLEKYLQREARMQAKTASPHKERKCTQAWDCLLQCGLRDGLPNAGQFCIDKQLAAAVRGDLAEGLFFRGAQRLPFGTAIRPVRELLRYLTTGELPVTQPAGT